MKGDERIIESLNARLSDELAAINQYMVHAEMCEDWGYGRLHEAIEARAMQEMKHAEALIGRIIFLEGRPIVSNLGAIRIGADVETQIGNDWQAERDAIRDYNESIGLAVEVGDNGSKELFESILTEEEEHIDWIETQQDEIQHMGIQNYLVAQID